VFNLQTNLINLNIFI